MLQRFFFVALICAATCSTGSVLAEENPWSDDPQAAAKLAKGEGKDLLLLYTGSDWCPPCQKLEQEVFDDEDFYAEAEQHFVFVKFDFLRKSPISEKTKALNQEWAKKYGVDTFPTVILVDAKLRPYAFAGYEEGGTENYLGMLEENRQTRLKRDEKLAAAAKAKGDERAKLLDEALSAIPREISQVYYNEIIEEIVKLDQDDELGLRTKWNEARDAEFRKAVLTDVMMIARLQTPEKAVTMIDELLGSVKFTTWQRLAVMQVKLNLVRQLGNPALVDDLLDQMMKMEGLGDSTIERLIVKKVYLMVGSKRREKAMKYLEQAIKESQAQGRSGAYLLTCKAELLDSNEEFDEASTVFDLAIAAAKAKPDLLAEATSGKADSLYASGKEAEALQVLDSFADDTDLPGDLRADALLHKSMLMRESGKHRTARLVENRAKEIVESTKERTEIQEVVERLRKKYAK